MPARVLSANLGDLDVSEVTIEDAPAKAVESGVECPSSEANRDLWSDEFVVVQGVIDILMEESDGLTSLDCKTDDIPLSAVPSRASAYTPQVALYALAAERTLGKAVKKVSIIFLGPSREVEIDWRSYLRARGLI